MAPRDDGACQVGRTLDLSGQPIRSVGNITDCSRTFGECSRMIEESSREFEESSRTFLRCSRTIEESSRNITGYSRTFQESSRTFIDYSRIFMERSRNPLSITRNIHLLRGIRPLIRRNTDTISLAYDDVARRVIPCPFPAYPRPSPIRKNHEKDHPSPYPLPVPPPGRGRGPRLLRCGARIKAQGILWRGKPRQIWGLSARGHEL